jgi:4-phospho-D-threonate 3-dehydrogenase / 4-phospho-D-erythronate 3-dehydrogenase
VRARPARLTYRDRSIFYASLAGGPFNHVSFVKQKPVIGITMGDPAGIGSEVVDKALSAVSPRALGVSFHLIGQSSKSQPGRPSLKSARVALAALEESVALLKAGKIQAVVNAPVAKAGLNKVGFAYPGQTEFYAQAFGLRAEQVTMMMVSEKLKVALTSTHCSLRQAIARLKPQDILIHGTSLFEMLQHQGIKKPRIAVCGLNPHAGEKGLFGQEEEKIIIPGIKMLRKKHRSPVTVTGPHSPDAVFIQALRGEVDGVLSLYHDQGLIPFKLVAFAEGVNLTWGLPFVRVSPDHGTAFDIAGKGVACSASMEAALRLAARLTTHQQK